MRFDSDVALLGTGLAPLIAASRFLSEGKSVLLLNPDRDFFLEDSELPLDPCLPALGPGSLRADRLEAHLPEQAFEVLSPLYPGSVEMWPARASDPADYHDSTAPHLRARSRLFAASGQDFARLEDFYVEAADAGLHPQLLEGMQAGKRFPGVAVASENVRGVMVPRICDVDVVPYRNGVLEFVRERVDPGGAERLLCGVSQVELMPGGVRFHAGGAAHTARISDGVLVFWTPRLTPWILAQAKRAELPSEVLAQMMPAGLRHWEEWSLVSRTAIDPAVVGVTRDVAVWAEIEGSPQRRGVPAVSAGADVEHRLTVLRGGRLLPAGSATSGGESWASAESFEALGELLQGFLKWERFSVRSMRPRSILDWGAPAGANEGRDPRQSMSRVLSWRDPFARVVSHCDGPIVDVVRSARDAAEALLARDGGAE